MKFDPSILGAGLMSAGGLLSKLGNTAAAYWIGIAFITVGPFVMAVRFRKSKSKKPTP